MVTAQNKFAEPSVSYFSRTVIPFPLSQRRVKEEGGGVVETGLGEAGALSREIVFTSLRSDECLLAKL